MGLSDLAHHPEFVEQEVGRRLRGDGPLSFDAVSWPKPQGGFRSLAVLDPIDEISMRVAVTPIVHKIDRSLHRSVYSGNLQKGGPGWHFRRPNGVWKRLRRDLTNNIRNAPFSSFLRTDVSSFYSSIPSSIHADLAIRFDPSGKFLPFLDPFFETWRAEGLVGLPIGPEISLLLANAVLTPLDKMIDGLGYVFARYTDDVFVLNVDPADHQKFLRSIDSTLATIDLTRSTTKTDFTTEFDEAMEWVNDSFIASTLSALKTDPMAGEMSTAAMYEREARAVDPDSGRLSFALKVFENRGDGRAVDMLIQNRKLAQVNPRVTGDYLGTIASRRARAVDGIGERIRSGARSDATDLHLLRAATARGWGRSDGRSFRNIVLDDRTPAVNRGWAVQVWSESKDFDPSLATDIAVYGDDVLARAACISLRKATRRTRRLASRHVPRLRPSLTHTCRWVRTRESTT